VSMQSTGAFMVDTDAAIEATEAVAATEPRLAAEPVWEFAWNRAVDEQGVSQSEATSCVQSQADSNKGECEAMCSEDCVCSYCVETDDTSFYCEGQEGAASAAASGSDFDVAPSKLYSLLGEVYHQLAVVNTERLDLIEHNQDLRDELKAVEGGSHWELMHRCSALQEQVSVYSKVLVQINEEMDQLTEENTKLWDRVKNSDTSGAADPSAALPPQAELWQRIGALEYENKLYDATVRQLNDAMQMTDDENARLREQLQQQDETASNVSLPNVSLLRKKFDMLYARCEGSSPSEDSSEHCAAVSTALVNEIGSMVYSLYVQLLDSPCARLESREDCRQQLADWGSAGIGGCLFV